MERMRFTEDVLTKGHLCILATGGTIAARPTKSGLKPTLTGADVLEMIPEIEELADIDCIDILQLNSTNLQPKHWQVIARAVARYYDDYDGFVILHGTNTLAYTAAALYYMLNRVGKPVVVTGSQTPAGEFGTDAPQNVLAACTVALSGRAGVYVVFGGCIIAGNAARKLCSRNYQAFSSIQRPAEGVTQGGSIRWQVPPKIPTGKFQLCDELDDKVAVLKLFPGIEPRILHYLIDRGYHAVILEGYGLGGVPGADTSLDFLPEIAYARKKGCLIVCTTQCVYDGADLSCYEVGVEAERLGAISGGALPTEALLPKLMLLLAQTRSQEEIAKFLPE